ncbi:hypothetical protein QEV59_10640 [Trueperella pyogenes]|uniref:hypothetical protein n=1 Tax=Trueperella pyogenes TaxID=1661 RepID=UPI003132AAC5
MFLVFSSLATIFGFTVQDRFALSATTTAGISAIYLTVMGITMIIAQAMIAPKTGWSAAKLLRTGLIITLVATVLIWPTPSRPLGRRMYSAGLRHGIGHARIQHLCPP